jgi:outer membrane receptor protein involved in Fe transport
MFRTSRSRLLASSILIGAFAAASPAAAQSQPQEAAQELPAENSANTPDEQDSDNDIVVTGTLIKNPNATLSSPVSVIGEQEIELREANLAEQFLRELPGTAASIGSNVNNGQGGSSFVDLRGLGINRNVVLLDGTRMVPARADAAPDLNIIPLALIERVDVLTGGASTTYGADAVSGVVNFITKQDFAGAELEASQQITEKGDGQIFRADLTAGANFEDGRGNAVLSIGYQKADPVYQGDRAFSASNVDSSSGTTGGSGTTVPTRISVPNGGGTRQLDPTTGTLVSTFATFNFNPYNLLQTPFTRYNVFGAAHYEVTDGVEVYAQGLYSRNQSKSIVAPSGTFGNPYFIPISNPFLPAGARTQFCTAIGLTSGQCAAAAAATNPADPNYREFQSAVFRRFVEAGTRDAVYTTSFFQQKVGVRGSITSNLDFDLFGTYGRSELLRESLHYGLSSRVQQALRATSTAACTDTANNCVPLNIFGPAGSITPQMLAFIDAASASDRQNTSMSQVRGVISGDIGTLTGASDKPVSIAFGGEYRHNFAKREADSLSQQPGEVLGLGGAPQTTNNRTSVKELFGEIVAPILSDRPFFRSLTLELGARYSDYSTTGGAWTYKVGGSWEPVSGLKFRGNYNRATRSPTIFELYGTQQTILNNQDFDPCQGTAPLSSANLKAVCLAQGAPPATIGTIQAPSAAQVNITTSGNPNLDVEKADTYTLGFVFQPEFIPNLTFTADYYNIRIKDAITTPTIDDQLRECFGGSTPATALNPPASAASSPECTADFRRNPLTGGLDGSAATTRGIFLPLSNQGFIKTDGIDIALNYRRELGFARLNFNLNGNWTHRSQFRSKAGSILRECIGYYSVNCGGPGNGTTNFGSVGSIQPKYSWNARTTLTFPDQIDVSLLWRHISAVDVEPVVATNFLEKFRHISAYDWFDLTTRFNINPHLSVTFVVQNLLDKKPPIVGSTIGATAYNSGNTYPSTYDAIGRRFTAAARLKF